MPRLPDKTALGQDPSLNTPERIITGPQYGSGIVAGAIGDVGQAMTGVGEEMQQQQDHIQLARAETDRIKNTTDFAYQLKQDSDYSTYLPRFDAATAKINADAAANISNPQARQLFLARAGGESRRERALVESQADRYRQEDLHVTTGNMVDAMLGELRANPTPERAQQILANADTEITGAGKSGLSPRHVQDLRDKHLSGINSGLYRYANERLWDQNDKDAALNTLNDLKAGPTPSTSGDSTTDFIKRQEGFTPKAKWDHKQYSSGYGTVAAPGETITKDEAEKRLKQETGRIGEWIDDNITAPLSAKQRTALTSFGYNLGTGAGGLSDLKDDINAGNFDRVAQRMQSYNRAGGQSNIQLARRRREEADLLRSGPDSSEATDQGGSDSSTQQSGWAPLYRKYLSPTAIYHLTTNAQRAMHGRLLQEGNDAFDAVSNTGKIPVDENGRTVLDRAARGGLFPSQIDKLKDKLEGGKDIYDNLQGIADLNPDDQNKKWADLAPERRTAAAKARGETPRSYSQMQKTQDAVGSYLALLREWGNKDPAAFVEGGDLQGGRSHRVVGTPDGGFDTVEDGSESKRHVPAAPEVKQARELLKVQRAAMDPNDPNALQAMNENLVYARLAAQTRRGIQPDTYDDKGQMVSRGEQRAITMKEANSLLKFHPGMTDEEISNAVAAAKNNADALYGRYSQRAMRDAVDLVVKTHTAHEAAVGTISALVAGRIPHSGWAPQYPADRFGARSAAQDTSQSTIATENTQNQARPQATETQKEILRKKIQGENSSDPAARASALAARAAWDSIFTSGASERDAPRTKR